jgi:hypothetical protein
MRTPTAALILALALAGCSRGGEPPDPRIEQQQAEVQALQKKVADLERSQGAQIADTAKTTTERLDRLDDASQRRVNEQRRLIEELQERIAIAERKITVLETATPPAPVAAPAPREEPKTPKVSVYSAPDPVLEDFIEPPTDRFPLRVFDVASRKVVTGTHTSTRHVQTDEIVKDEYGSKGPRIERKDVEVNEYAYQVVFSARNLTKTPKALIARAGGDPVTQMVPAGATVTNVAVGSVMGADLWVSAGAESRSFAVVHETGK